MSYFARILTAQQKKEQLLEVKRQEEEALKPENIKKRSRIELAIIRGKVKMLIAEAINDPKSELPLTITNHITGSIWEAGEEYIRSWLDDEGYSLVVNWYDSSNGDFVADIVVDYKQ